jgi:hypothetical protein
MGAAKAIDAILRLDSLLAAGFTLLAAGFTLLAAEVDSHPDFPVKDSGHPGVVDVPQPVALLIFISYIIQILLF